MSDQRISSHLRDINKSPSHTKEQQQQSSLSTTKKNHHLRKQYPPFSIPSSIYQVLYINKWTTMETMDLILDHVRNCTEYTCDTESEKSNYELALLQIQTLPRVLPSFVLLVELAHLPSSQSLTMVKIIEFFGLIFRSKNILYSWGPFRVEISSAKNYCLFEWPIAASVVDIQVKFPDWYSWALSHCETCCPSLHHNITGESVKLDDGDNVSFKCICHKPSPYRPHKSMRLNHWAVGLDPTYSTLSTTWT